MSQSKCDNCIHSKFIFATMRIDDENRMICRKNHRIHFEFSRQADRFGWFPNQPCRDYKTIFTGKRMADPVPYRSVPAYKRKHHPAADQSPAVMPDKKLDPPNGPYRGRIEAADRPGVREVEEKYAADLSAGRNTANRIFGKDS